MEKKYANKHGYSDVDPYEIVKINTERKMTIRYMNAELVQAPTFQVGGFSAHANNYAQKWEITSDETAPEFAIRLNKKGEWKDKHGGRYVISEAPSKFYDYNF